MVLSRFLSRSSGKSANPEPQPAVSKDGRLAEPVQPPPVTAPSQPSADTRPSLSIYSSDVPQEAPALESPAVVTAELTISSADAPSGAPDDLKPPMPRARRFSWRGISLFNGASQEEHKASLSADAEQKKKAQVAEDRVKRAVKVSGADRRARESAFIVRSLIVGQSAITLSDAKGKPAPRPKISKVKVELMQPKKANRVIAQLRALPSTSDALPHSPKSDVAHEHLVPAHPIHAVCLPYNDAEADAQHFSKLTVGTTAHPLGFERALNTESALSEVASVYNTSLVELKAMLADMHIVNLLTMDLGIGEPGDGPGLLSGAIPTAKTIIDGVEQVTPELMSLGYATGKVLLPDHTGIHPPTDRMSVLTYWWGFEVMLPPPSIKYLSGVPSIAHSVINVLTALSVLNGGIREILPFVRYISSFIDTEFDNIKQQDHGKGVICAATWLIPAALVPRPWDFPDSPIVKIQPAPTDSTPEHHSESSEPTHAHHEPSLSLPNPYPEETEPAAKPQSPTSPSPSLPPLPASPTLLPPLPAFDSDEAPAKSPPVDDTPLPAEVSNGVQTNGKGDAAVAGDKDIPAVSVVPPTPPSSNTLRGAPDDVAQPEHEAVAVAA